jgi:UDP-N-acetylmuramate dehydrogenase
MDSISQAIGSAGERLPHIKCLLNEPLKDHTSFRIGGPARVMFFPESAGDLAGLCCLLREYDISPLVIGNGTNLLAGDGVLDVVVVNMTGHCSIKRTGETEITADSGAPLAKLAVFACQNGLSGLEFAHGIPGTLGGAVLMNAGAYGGEMKDVIHSTSVYSHESGISAIKGEGHGFSYRHSRFAETGDIVLSSVIRLQKGDREAIKAQMEKLALSRRDSQPLDLPSAGSIFKRPKDGYAAALIEQAGLKGFAAGGAQVSKKHSGFIVNLGGATFSDVMAVIGHVQDTVFKQFEVELELEIRVIK